VKENLKPWTYKRSKDNRKVSDGVPIA
jgi:hypothetical protein